MITFLHGKLIAAVPTQATVDVGGVGYEVLIPVSSFERLPPIGSEIKILTHLVVREDAHILYGFMSTEERQMFRLLVGTVSGIGPKIALGILSGMNVVALRGAVAAGDVKTLSQIPGVGRKTAERVVVELRDKIGPAGAWEAASSQHAGADGKVMDAVAALVVLGVKQDEAYRSVCEAKAKLGATATVEQLVKGSFRKPR